MATALSALRTRFRYRLRDTETTYTYADSVLNAWINAGVSVINREVPYLLTNANINAASIDGSTYEFDLASADLNTDFLRIRLITPIIDGYKPLTRHPEGMTHIRFLEANSLIEAGTPTHYATEGTNVLFDRIPAVGDTITCDYYQKHTTLALDASTLTGLIAEGWDRLILASATLEAGDDIPNELAEKIQDKAELFMYGDPKKKNSKGALHKFEDWVHENLGHMDNVAASPYVDIRGGEAIQPGAIDFQDHRGVTDIY